MALACDGSGNLLVADHDADTIFKIAPGGERSVFAPGVHWPNGLVLDAVGNLFAVSPGSRDVGGTILKFGPDGAKTVFATDVGFPLGLAIDATGNLFASDMNTGSILKFSPAGRRSVFATGVGYVSGLAVDGSGNLFASGSGAGAIFKFTPKGDKTTFVGGVSIAALAFDQAGNLFAGDDAQGAICRFSPTGAKTVVAKVAPGGLQARGLAFDAAGNLFASDLITGAIYRFTPEGTRSALIAGRPEPPAAQPEEGADSSADLPAEYAKDYLIASGTASPDKRFAVIYPTRDSEDFPSGANIVVSLKPFSVLGKLDTKWPYHKNESHGGLSADWSEDGSVALITLDSKWGPGDIFLVEFREARLFRTTNLLAKIHDLLLPDYRKAKPERYNEYFDFIFESEDEPICELDGTNQVRIDGRATTDPKGLSRRRWSAQVKAVWDIPKAKFIEQKITRSTAKKSD